MTDFESNAISYLFTQVDTIGAQMVAQSYQKLVQHYRLVIYSLTSVYIGFIFLKMQRGHYDANDFIMIVLRTVIILTLALNYNYFCLYIYNIIDKSTWIALTPPTIPYSAKFLVTIP